MIIQDLFFFLFSSLFSLFFFLFLINDKPTGSTIIKTIQLFFVFLFFFLFSLSFSNKQVGSTNHQNNTSPPHKQSLSKQSFLQQPEHLSTINKVLSKQINMKISKTHIANENSNHLHSVLKFKSHLTILR